MINSPERILLLYNAEIKKLKHPINIISRRFSIKNMRYTSGKDRKLLLLECILIVSYRDF